jgi:hypothetical protein
VVAKAIGHRTAHRKLPVAAKVGSLKVAARSEQLKRQSPDLRKGSMRMRKGRERQRRKRISSLTGLSRPGLTGRWTWTKRI